MNTLQELCAQALKADPSLSIIEFQRQWYTWGELRAVADRVVELIAQVGAATRAPIVLISRNRPASVASLFGLMREGRHIRMIYPFQSPASIGRNLDRVRPAVVVIGAEDVSEEMQSIIRQRGLAGIVLDGMDVRLLDGCERSIATAEDVQATPEIHVLTSGTTGPPKQFAVSYEMIAKHMVGQSLGRAKPRQEGAPPPPMYLYFPLGNITGIYSTVPALIQGARIVLGDRFALHEWHDYVVRYRPDTAGLPPPAVQMVLDANIPKADLASLRWIGTGAAPLDPHVQSTFEARYDIPLILFYGATEFAGPAVGMTLELHREWAKKKIGTVGRPLPGIQIRVVDTETGAVLPCGKEGLLEVIVPRVGPEWIRTADVAMIDEDGFMFHLGRADGAIMRGGFKILPETIERALLLHDAVSAAGVVGVPDPRLGQVPAAAIEIKPGVATPTIAELEHHLREHVLATHIPTTWRVVKELPKNPSFKVDRAALRRLFETPDGAAL